MEPHEKQVKWKWAWKCWRDQGQCKFRGWWSRLESSNHALSSVYVSFSSVFNVSLLGNQELYSHSLNMHSTCIHSCCASICRQSNSLSHTHTQIYTKSKTGTHTLTYRTPVHWHLHCVTLTDTVSPDLPHSNIHVLSGCLILLNPNIWTFNHHWPYIHNLSLHQIYSLLWDL